MDPAPGGALARQMSWEYHLVDATWDRMTGGSIDSVIAYGNASNVGTLIWYNGGGPNNTLGAATYWPRETTPLLRAR